MLVVDWLSHVNELFINVISITHLLWLQVTFYSEKRFLSVYLLAQTRFPDFFERNPLGSEQETISVRLVLVVNILQFLDSAVKYSNVSLITQGVNCSIVGYNKIFNIVEIFHVMTLKEGNLPLSQTCDITLQLVFSL